MTSVIKVNCCKDLHTPSRRAGDAVSCLSKGPKFCAIGAITGDKRGTALLADCMEVIKS